MASGSEEAWRVIRNASQARGDVTCVLARIDGAIAFLENSSGTESKLREVWWDAEQINAGALAEGRDLTVQERFDLDAAMSEMGDLAAQQFRSSEWTT